MADAPPISGNGAALARRFAEDRAAIDASDWETCAKIQEQLVRKLDEVKALMQTSGPV